MTSQISMFLALYRKISHIPHQSGNKFFIISQSLVTLVAFGLRVTFFHPLVTRNESKESRARREKKKLEKFIEFDLSTFWDFECLETEKLE